MKTTIIYSKIEDALSLPSSYIIDAVSKIKLNKKKRESLAAWKLIEKLIGSKELHAIEKRNNRYYHPRYYLSVTHSDIFVAVGVSEEMLGIDLEEKKRDIFDLRLFNKISTTNEKAFYRMTPSKEDILTLWTKKEAFFKFNNDKYNVDTINLAFSCLDNKDFVLTCYPKGDISFIELENQK